MRVEFTPKPGSAVAQSRALTSSNSPLGPVSAMPAESSSATVPARCGDAIDVPLCAEYPCGEQNMQAPVGTVEMIWSPGAATSTSGPVHENPVSASLPFVNVVDSTWGYAPG